MPPLIYRETPYPSGISRRHQKYRKTDDRITRSDPIRCQKEKKDDIPGQWNTSRRTARRTLLRTHTYYISSINVDCCQIRPENLTIERWCERQWTKFGFKRPFEWGYCYRRSHDSDRSSTIALTARECLADPHTSQIQGHTDAAAEDSVVSPYAPHTCPQHLPRELYDPMWESLTHDRPWTHSLADPLTCLCKQLRQKDDDTLPLS